MANSFVDICITYKLRQSDVFKKELTEREFFDELDEGEEFDIDSCQRFLELTDYIDVTVDDIEWIDLELLNVSTRCMLKQHHKIWKGNSLIISKWFKGSDIEETEFLLNLERNGEQRSLKISNIEDEFKILSDVVITENEELLNMRD